MTTTHTNSTGSELTMADVISAWERNYDAQSQEFISTLTLPPAPAVADIGAGRGSMSAWFQRALPESTVCALDTDVAGLAGLAGLPRLQVVQADATTHDMPPGSFDLIFVRAVLSVVQSPQQALDRWVTWLRPGGQLVAEDFYFMAPEDAATDLGSQILRGYVQANAESGADLRLARRLPSMLARAGLQDVRNAVRPLGPGQGETENALMDVRMRVERSSLVERGLLTDEQITAWLATLDDPACQDITTLGVRTWGTRS